MNHQPHRLSSDHGRSPDPGGLGAAGAKITRVDAFAILDGRSWEAIPGSLLLESVEPTHGRSGPRRLRVLAAGKAHDVLEHPAAQLPSTRVVSVPDQIVIPGLINAHTHLDLTHIGPQPHDPAAGFVPWVDMVRSRRHVDDAAIAGSVRQGIALCRDAGTVAIGDIAGAPMGRMSLVPWRTMREMGMAGVSYAEFFGIGNSREPRERGLRELVASVMDEAQAAAAGGDVRFGLQPHAPNTVSKRLYEVACTLVEGLPGEPICTHLAETPEERRFVGVGDGPQRELLERFGLWTDEILIELGRGEHPVKHMETVLRSRRFNVVHVNDATDEAIEILAKTNATVIYCPRASAYFASESNFGPHRYRDMISAGIPVALGTDSLINLPTEAGRSPADAHTPGNGMSILDEMRFLFERDGTYPATLLTMGVRHGIRALGLDETHEGFDPGSVLLGLAAVRINRPLGGSSAGSAGGVGSLLMRSSEPCRLLPL